MLSLHSFSYFNKNRKIKGAMSNTDVQYLYETFKFPEPLRKSSLRDNNIDDAHYNMKKRGEISADDDNEDTIEQYFIATINDSKKKKNLTKSKI
jgi:hypothetical protein